MKLRGAAVVGALIIMNVATFFNSFSKKFDLRDQSCNVDEPKKAREGNPNDSKVH